MSEVRRVASEKLKGVCVVCKHCNGLACAGQVPGYGGAGTGSGFMNNVEALAKVMVNLRVLHEDIEPKMGVELFGMKLSMPILGAAVAGVKVNRMPGLTEDELARAMMLGPVMAGTIGMGGDGGDSDVHDSTMRVLIEAEGRAIPVIKPRANEEIIRKALKASENGAKAVAIDVDAAGLVNMALTGQKVEPKAQDKIAEIVESAGVPVILKGIMTPEDALTAARAGAAGIVVSNHGGRAIDCTPGTAAVLPGIARAVKGKLTILADGGIRSGLDVLKMLALGADAVLIGRPLAIVGAGGGPEAVKQQLETYLAQLKVAMILTGAADVRSVPENVLYR
jgi:isopentenyl diphosphate isomerase/L-lactate dehydrogenase-like FMN-dependent dehydrogenase